MWGNQIIYQHLHINYEKKKKRDNSHSRWRLHKEQNSHNGCTTCQKWTEFHATYTINIPFNKKELLYSVQHIEWQCCLVSPADNYEIASLQIQQPRVWQQGSWLHLTDGKYNSFLYLRCTSKKFHDQISLGKSSFTLLI